MAPFKGGDTPPHTGNVWKTIGFGMCIVELFRSFAFFGSREVMPMFLTNRMGLTATDMTVYKNLASVVSYSSPMIFGYLADTKFGRYDLALYGMLLMTLSSGLVLIADFIRSPALALVANCAIHSLGYGMMKVNVMVFALDQFNRNKSDQVLQRQKYLDMRYWFLNTGATVGSFFVGNIVEGCFGYGPEVTFKAGFVYFLSMNIIMVGYFHHLSKRCWVAPTGANALGDFYTVTRAAMVNSPGRSGTCIVIGLMTLFAAVGISIPTMIFKPLGDANVGGFTFRHFIASLILLGSIMMIVGSVIQLRHETPFIMAAVGNCNFDKKYIIGVGQAWKVMVFIPLEITYMLNYLQMDTTYHSVSCMYDSTSILGFWKINAATMSLFNAITVVLWMPFLTYCVYPTLTRMGGIWHPTPLKKIGMGFTFTGLAQFCAMYLEVTRKNTPFKMTMCDDDTMALGYCTADMLGQMVPKLSYCYEYVGENASEPVPVHDVSVLWMALPYIIFAMSEVAVCTFYELFYSQCPSNLSGVCQALNFFSASLGAALASVLVKVFAEYLPNNCNDGHYEYFFATIGGLEIINFVLFVYIASIFVYLPGTSGRPGDSIEDTIESSATEESATTEESEVQIPATTAE